MVTILIVDDDRMNCDLLAAVFTRYGYYVVTTTSGREGLELFRQHDPRVTLLDLRMPEMDGLTVLREIRALDPQASVIILGGGASELQENQARELRVTDFLRKGLSLDVLVGAVQQIAQQPVKTAFTPTTPQAFGSGGEEKETILVVDDEPLVRDLLVQFVNLRGYRARGAKDGQEALALVAQTHPDLILLDIMMPGMNGVDVFRALREREYAGGVIFLTGSQSEELLEKAWALGPQEVIGKPVDLDRLLTAIQLVLVCRAC
ncbi:MAG: response regulator [Nitrospiraceae bacterium]